MGYHYIAPSFFLFLDLFFLLLTYTHTIQSVSTLYICLVYLLQVHWLVLSPAEVVVMIDLILVSGEQSQVLIDLPNSQSPPPLGARASMPLIVL